MYLKRSLQPPRWPTPWFSLGYLLLLLLMLSFIRAIDATLQIMVNETDITVHLYDFQGDNVTPYVYHGPLVPLTLTSNCQWSDQVATRHLNNLEAAVAERSQRADDGALDLVAALTDATNKTEARQQTLQRALVTELLQRTRQERSSVTSNASYNGTIMFFNQLDLVAQGCRKYIDVLQQGTDIVRFLEGRGYPTPKVFLFSTSQRSEDNFGFVETDLFDDYYPHWDFAPNGTQLALVNYGAGLLLRKSGIVITTIIQDEGVWNKFLASGNWLACRIINYIMILPAALYAVYQIGYLFYKRGLEFNLRVFIFITSLYFMAVAVAIPLGQPTTVTDHVLRFSSWICGYVGANAIIMSWAHIITKIGGPLRLPFVRILHVACILHILPICALSVMGLVHTFVRSYGMGIYMIGLARYGLANIVIAQSVLLVAYGTWFLYRVRHTAMSVASRRVLVRLTSLIFCIVVGILLNTATVLINFNPAVNPALITVRNIMLSFCVFFVFGTVFYFLRIQDQKEGSILHPQDGTDHSCGMHPLHHYDGPTKVTTGVGSSPGLVPPSPVARYLV
ncbi:hypothetical protein H4R35_006775 [Dimargaris xerosporica]|nr:hypothetical protein H4R35_006775 [Dimargaris xerosporica]